MSELIYESLFFWILILQNVSVCVCKLWVWSANCECVQIVKWKPWSSNCVCAICECEVHTVSASYECEVQLCLSNFGKLWSANCVEVLLRVFWFTIFLINYTDSWSNRTNCKPKFIVNEPCSTIIKLNQ